MKLRPVMTNRAQHNHATRLFEPGARSVLGVATISIPHLLPARHYPKERAMNTKTENRYTTSNPCPVCERAGSGPTPHCHGILSDDGSFARCTNDDGGGKAKWDEKCLPPAWVWKREPDGTYRPWTKEPPSGPVRVKKRVREAYRASTNPSADEKRIPAPLAYGSHVTIHTYKDEAGEPLYRVLRQGRGEGKRIWQEHYADGAWWRGLTSTTARTLYRLPALVNAPAGTTVHLPEGEACADALNALGLIATAWTGGADQARTTLPLLRAHLSGHHVVLHSDSDAPGRQAMASIACGLADVTASVRVVDYYPDAHSDDHAHYKGDVVDWLGEGHDAEDLTALIDATQPYELPENELDATADAERDEADAPLIAGPYSVQDGRICWRKQSGDGVVFVPLCNFVAAITEEVISDDGVEPRGELAITGTLASGEPLPLVRVPLAQFQAMNWPLTAWGTRAVVSAGVGAKDRLREGVQLLSPDANRRTEYAHTGWRQIGGRWAFLHAGGAIDADGPVPDVVVQLTGNLVRAALPAPPTGEARTAAIHAALSLLALAPLPITAPLFGAVYRAPLNVARLADVTVALIGFTGVRKSELAALAQQHTGADFDRLHLPAAWSATANALERLLFTAKDMVAVIDDFAPTGTQTEQARLHATADRVIRGAGNGAARGRMRADGGMRPDYPPRGLAIVTGEEAPRGQSLKGRMVIVEMSPGDVALDRLTLAQRHGADGILAAAFAGYVQWLAPRMDSLAATVRDDLVALRDEARDFTAHARTPENVAHLLLGWRYWLDYAEDAGAITGAEHEALWGQLRAALGTTATAQGEHQHEEPARRFLDYVLAAVQSGEGHIAAMDGSAPGHGEDAMWGWRVVERETANGDTLRSTMPQGKCVGWLDHEHDLLYLQPDAAYAVAQRMTAATGAALPVTVRTLGRRLHERNLLAATGGEGEYTVKRTVAGRKTRVLCMSPTALSSLTAGTSGTAPRTAHGEEKNTVPDDVEATGMTGTLPDYPGREAAGVPDTAPQTSGHDMIAGTELAHWEGGEPGIPDVPADLDSRLDSVTTHYTRAQMRMWLDHAAGQKTLTTIPVGVRAFASARGINQRRDESPMQFVARLRAALWGEAA